MTTRLGPALALLMLGAELARADVVTSLSGSHLTITGDETADSIAITPGEGGIRLAGFDGTLVDGSSDEATFSGVRRLTVRLMHGADRILVSWITLPDALYVGMGKGDDTVELDEVVAGDVTVATSQGFDVVNVFGPSYFDSLSIRTGSGSDLVVVDDVAVGGDLDVVSGRDDDDVSLAWLDVYDDVDVHLGNGDDNLWFGDATVGEDTHLEGNDGDNWLDLYGYLAFWDDVDIDGFGDGGWWWW